METLAFALRYVQQGFSVIPLKPGTKIPILGTWEPYQRKVAPNEQLGIWFSNGHAANNIALVTGKISRVIAFDNDGEEASTCFNRAVESLNDEALKTALKHTMHIRTANGNTNVVIGFKEEGFSLDDKLIANRVLWTNGKHSEIRVKGEGGYIVAPPSALADGKTYELIDGKSAVVILSRTEINKLIFAIRKQAKDYSPKNDSGTPMDGTNGAIMGAISDVKNAALNEEDVYDIVSILKPYYQHGKRNDFTMYLSGWMRKEGIPFDSALKVIECIAADDEEKSARIRTLEETYKKQGLEKVCGYSGLLSIIINQTKNQDMAKQILEQVESVFPKIQDGKQSKGAAPEEQKSESRILIELAHANVSLLFKDQHGTAFALIVPIKGRKELIALESNKFRRYLAKLFYDNRKGIAKTEHVNNAIQILKQM